MNCEWCVKEFKSKNKARNYRNNLRLVCPNCDSQLDTFKSKNKSSARQKYRKTYKPMEPNNENIISGGDDIGELLTGNADDTTEGMLKQPVESR